MIEENSDETNDNTNTVKQENISLYFWNKENNRLICETRNIITTDGNLTLNDIVVALLKGPDSKDLQPVIPKETKIIDIGQTDNIVTINLTEDFLNAEDLLVARSALVNTLAERQGVKYVKILINGKELTNDGTLEGEPLGVLKDNQ